MRGDGFVNPGADRDGMTICLPLKMCIVWVSQTQDEKQMNQQIQTERCDGNRPE